MEVSTWDQSTSQAPHPSRFLQTLGLEMTDMAPDGQEKMWRLDVSTRTGISQGRIYSWIGNEIEIPSRHLTGGFKRDVALVCQGPT